MGQIYGPTISVEEAQKLLGISRAHVYSCCASGEIPAIRMGKRWVIVTSKLLEKLGLDDVGEQSVPFTCGPADGPSKKSTAKRTSA